MKIILKNRSLLKVSGKDSDEFIQNQFTNDIRKLNHTKVQINAYCQHQGKIIALFWVIRMDEALFLSFPADLLEKIEARLKMFVIMSDVIIEDVTNVYKQIGLINESTTESFRINDSLGLLIEDSKTKVEGLSENELIWNKTCFDSCLPEIYNQTSEKLVPQMLNLDIDEAGVNFSKGCYPGQEVVARLHYLGSAKRRLFSFISDHEVSIGDSIYCATSEAALARGSRYKGTGMVVTRVKYDSLFYCLATLDEELKDEQITLNNNHGPILKRINNE